MSFSNSEVLPSLSGWFRPLIGRDPYNQKLVQDSKNAAFKAIHALEQHFLVNTFLVGERITLADLFVASQIARGFQYVLDKPWRAENPIVTRWYETVINQPIWKAVVKEPIFVEECVKYTPPKKEKVAKAAAAAPTPKAEKTMRSQPPNSQRQSTPSKLSLSQPSSSMTGSANTPTKTPEQPRCPGSGNNTRKTSTLSGVWTTSTTKS
jgi:elongation factor 1-gamma